MVTSGDPPFHGRVTGHRQDTVPGLGMFAHVLHPASGPFQQHGIPHPTLPTSCSGAARRIISHHSASDAKAAAYSPIRVMC